MQCRLVLLLVALLVHLLCIRVTDAAAGPRATSEYAVKAAFLFNFAKFVSWPGEAFKGEKSPLVFCIAGHDPFGSALDALQNKAVRGRKIETKRIPRTDAPEQCHVLFTSKEEQRSLHQLLSAVRGRPVLTVGETEEFARTGGIVNFVLMDDRIRFEINPEEGRRAGLKISAQLLKLATIVNTKGAEK